MIFYTPDIDAQQYTLHEEESAHAVRVLRLKENDRITLVDGKGGCYDAVVLRPHPKHCEIEVLAVQQKFAQRPYYLHIAIAPTKNIDRFEWFVEKSVEIGIDEISPVHCAHSERKSIPIERIQRIAVAAMKQSEKAYLPKINELISFENWLNTCASEKKLIACCGDCEKQTIKNACSPTEHVAIAIGPEGDFSPDEVNKALHHGFECITLGKSRLRTETAGIVACHSIAWINN
jgi:16S rRNA (uracil1498-N3)-methyltransferase